jgi:hypothetical protein
VRRAVLTALLFALVFLPILLEVATAFAAPAPAGERVALLTSRKTLDFGARPVGSTTPAVTLVVTNPGTGEVPITGVKIAGAHSADFTLVESTCRTLTPNAVCTIVARFAPTAAGPRTARILVANAASPLEIPLAGSGSDPSASKRTRRSQRYYR